MTVDREKYVEFVTKYQETNEEIYVEKMVLYLQKPIAQMTYRHLNVVKHYGYDYSDVYNLGIQELWEAMKTFNGEEGSDFLSYFTRLFQWKVNDEFIERRSGGAYNQMFAPVSVEHVMDSYQSNTTDNAVDSSVMEHFVAEDLNLHNVDSLVTYKHLLDLYITDKKGKGKAEHRGALNDVEILECVIEAIYLGYSGQRDINDYLYNAFPDKTRGSIRQNKTRAYQRFGNFIKEI